MADNKNTPQPKKATNQQFVFGKENYILLIAALVVIIIGYYLMSGGGNNGNPSIFAGDTLFNSQRLVVAPIVIMAGFVLGLVAILKKPKA